MGICPAVNVVAVAVAVVSISIAIVVVSIAIVVVNIVAVISIMMLGILLLLNENSIGCSAIRPNISRRVDGCRISNTGDGIFGQDGCNGYWR
ncbi:hypothetical protein KDW_59960 [Dictyobacter vulcani]|uniref:Uncharacterized protein n=1 Tax=Dictyobacter vulcani TaxID=2607529 RepID=A0A5J4KR30_9CHLR|nr:hypothetical protein KDW_59960 [Dictyobacter vulcani]